MRNLMEFWSKFFDSIAFFQKANFIFGQNYPAIIAAQPHAGMAWNIEFAVGIRGQAMPPRLVVRARSEDRVGGGEEAASGTLARRRPPTDMCAVRRGVRAVHRAPPAPVPPSPDARGAASC